jgi:hypothetical protein
MSEGTPTGLAFLAMTQQQLGQKEQAQASLARLRGVLKQPEWAKHAEAQAFLHEAERLMDNEPAVPKK